MSTGIGLAKQKRQTCASSIEVAGNDVETNCEVLCGCWCQIEIVVCVDRDDEKFLQDNLTDKEELEWQLLTVLSLHVVFSQRFLVLSFRRPASVLREPCFIFVNEFARGTTDCTVHSF